MPSPASTESTAPNSRSPPSLVDPASGICSSAPPMLLIPRYQAFIEPPWMKNSLLRYFQT